MHCEQATLDNLQTPHWTQTREEMGHHPIVLILHDTTELDFTSHTALQGAGPIGNEHGRGFLQHNSLAVVPNPRRVLGLACQQVANRVPRPESETAAQRRERQRESHLWVKGIQAAGRAPQESRWVDVGDRGADAYEMMCASRDVGHDFLFRVCQDREVGIDANRSQVVKMREYATNLPSLGCDTVAIPSRGGRPSRVASVSLAAAPVWIPAPQNSLQRLSQMVIPAWVIQVAEIDPPDDVEPLEWTLVTSVPTETLADAMERRDWYACRWMVEEFHRIEKSGCGEEDRRFATASRMQACLAILSLVAVRVFQLRTALDNMPEVSATAVATTDELVVLNEMQTANNRIITVRDFVLAVGRPGGHLGRKSDGPPGTRTLWQGYQRLQDFVLGYQIRQRKRQGDVGKR